MMDEFYEWLGPVVKVIRVLDNNDMAIERLPAALAVEAVLRDALNGCEVIRARIVWDEVDGRLWDMSA